MMKNITKIASLILFFVSIAVAQDPFAKRTEPAAAMQKRVSKLQALQKHVNKQIREKQARLATVEIACKRESPFDQPFAESCLEVETLNQEIEDLYNLLGNLALQQTLKKATKS
jgi:hypothetical protein